jgi:hypothetical protein
VSINLEPGEIGLWQESAGLSEMRSHRYSTGGSVRVAKGVWVGARQYHSYRTRDIVDRGIVTVTTRRITFVGNAKTAQVLYRDLVNIDWGDRVNVINTQRRQNAVVIHYDGALIGYLLVKIFASAHLPDNRFPATWRLTAQAKRRGVDVQLAEEGVALST